MEEQELNTSLEKVAYLMDAFPEARENYAFLLLAYWKVFDDIAIPHSLFLEIMDKATQPETISRAKRKAKEFARMRAFLEQHQKAEASDQAMA
ncbi:hypothetical protein_gp011 [Bacillus phage vB_BceM_WH1]|nr:hypothetical protein_gp011 [Bacillus phage vB_BceM_WH1]